MIDTVQALSGNLRDLIQAYQEAHQLSQKQIADKLEMKAPAFNKFMKGTNGLSLPLLLNSINKLQMDPSKVFKTNIEN